MRHQNDMITRTQDALNPTALEAMQATFLERMPDFSDFTERSGAYWRHERAYKEELAGVCRSTLLRDLFAAAGSELGSQNVVRAVQRVLTVRLRSVNERQNLMGWRYAEFLQRMAAEERATFATGFGELLYGSPAVSDRVERFTSVMWPVWRRIAGGNPYALSRIFPTFFLMLLDADANIAVRTDMLDTAAEHLLGQRVLRNAPFGASEYRDVLRLATAVRRQLEAWGWCPRDMIDVHSFLWVATRDSYGGDVDAPSEES
jgi:hypothetical protein